MGGAIAVERLRHNQIVEHEDARLLIHGQGLMMQSELLGQQELLEHSTYAVCRNVPEAVDSEERLDLATCTVFANQQSLMITRRSIWG